MIYLLSVLGLLVAALIAGLLYQKAGSWLDRRRFPPPGKLTSAGVHVCCRGTGGPAVVLESGIAASGVSWAMVAPELARVTQVVTYDRPGLGWSEPLTGTLSPDRLADNLLRTLDETAVPGPYVLVGHSFGGLIARWFTQRYPDRVAGLVLVDPALVAEWAAPTLQRRTMLDRGIRFSRRGATLARFGVVRLGLALAAAGAHGAAKLVARSSSSPGGQKTVERLMGEIRKMPRELWPVIRAHWCQPKAFRSMAEHLEALPSLCAAVCTAKLPEGIPLIVISGGHLSEDQRAEHAAAGGEHVIAEGSGHWVHLDRPDLVIDAALRIVAAHRSAAAHR